MKKGVLVTGVFLAMSMALTVWGMDKASDSPKSKVVMGYISDVKCAESPNGVSADGFNLKETPEKHTTACMKMPVCEASGYGVFLKGSDGKYSFTKFDKKGNDLVKAFLKKTRKKDGLMMDVTGTFKNGILHVESIKEGMPGMKM